LRLFTESSVLSFVLCSAHAHVTAPLQKASTLETPEAKAAAAAAKEKHEMELLFKQVCALLTASHCLSRAEFLA
jgi:hypothetical protein